LQSVSFTGLSAIGIVGVVVKRLLALKQTQQNVVKENINTQQQYCQSIDVFSVPRLGFSVSLSGVCLPVMNFICILQQTPSFW